VIEGAEAVAVARENAEDLALVEWMVVAQDVGLGLDFELRFGFDEPCERFADFLD